ncbi:GntR family transcriptional regulator [Phytoactinopolyspora halotolerans]|uniref:UTRA domain-containing protein n=1 Tax=Phytoactinopolyspora halotolerans TaxID=1981512 RepID=A0A6L9SBC6_9ACTN|nr:GntR family transcriptional regulator [Phytoactinopolyspora halotolerans]NEE02437.1 UTRA domain-containing protein [Phytoactinopolyspora halotolerans]
MTRHTTSAHQTIELHLRELIAAASPGDRLPGDKDLSEQFGVSRMTARQAVSNLVGEGRVYRIRGSGTYVANDAVHRRVTRFLSFTEHMHRHGRRPSARVLETGSRVGTRQENHDLDQGVNGQIYYLTWVLLGDDIPIALEEVLLPAVCAEVLDTDLSSGSLHPALAAIGHEPVRAQGTLTAASAAQDVARLLEVPTGAALLVQQQIVREASGTPVQLAATRYVGERMVFDIDQEKHSYADPHERRREPFYGVASMSDRNERGNSMAPSAADRTGRLSVPEAELSVPGGLPDPLVAADGTPVTSADDWTRRRAELIDLFERHVYGRTPSKRVTMDSEVIASNPGAVEGRATRTEIQLRFAGGPTANLLLYVPNAVTERCPAFLGLNFWGNHELESDPEIVLSQQWMRGHGVGVVGNRATEASRGCEADRWPLAQILDRGYALATMYCGDLDPDYDDGFANGIHPLFYGPGQTRPARDEWGTLGAWAWGLSRALDYLETDSRIDAGQVIAFGHSRLGKAALWAAAQDTRFAMAASNNSGCGGAALSRRRVGETVEAITRRFPHWFCTAFNDYVDREDALPVDQHELIALIAPRPVCIGSAVGDEWADPAGEFLSARYADPVYRLLGVEGFSGTDMPDPGEAVTSRIAYHLRPGGHGITVHDWTRYLDSADRQLGAYLALTRPTAEASSLQN